MMIDCPHRLVRPGVLRHRYPDHPNLHHQESQVVHEQRGYRHLVRHRN